MGDRPLDKTALSRASSPTFSSSPYIINPRIKSPFDDVTVSVSQSFPQGPDLVSPAMSGTKLSGHQLLGDISDPKHK